MKKGRVRWGLAVLLLLAHVAEPACRVACSPNAEAQLSPQQLQPATPLRHSRSLLKSLFQSLKRQQADEAEEGDEAARKQKTRRSVRIKAAFHSRKRASAEPEQGAGLPAPKKIPLSEEAAASEGTAAQQSDKWRDLSPEQRIAAALEEKALAIREEPEQDGPEKQEHEKPSEEKDAEHPSEVADGDGNGDEAAKPDDEEDLQFSLDSILRRYNVKGPRPAPEKAPVPEAEEAADEGKADEPAEDGSSAEDAVPEDAATEDKAEASAEEARPEEHKAKDDQPELQEAEIEKQEHGRSILSTWLQPESKEKDGTEDGAKTDYTLSSLLAVLAMDDVRSMVAAPCSNIEWLEPVLRTAAEHKEYFSFTCVDEDVDALRATFSSELALQFLEKDFTEGGELPEAHLLYSQDVLQDLPLKTVVRVLESFAKSGAGLVLLGSPTQTRTLRTGGTPVKLNLQQAPFLLDKPLLVFGENIPDAPEQQLLLFSGEYLRSLQWEEMRARVKDFLAAQRRG